MIKSKFRFFGAFFSSLLFHALFFLILFYFFPLSKGIIPDEKYKNFKVTLRIPEETLLSVFEGMRKPNSYQGRKNNPQKIGVGTEGINRTSDRIKPESIEIKKKNNDRGNMFLENNADVKNSGQVQVLPVTPIGFTENISGYGTGGTGEGSGGFGGSDAVSAGSGYRGIGSGLSGNSFEEAKKHYKELVTKLIYEKKSYPKLAIKMKAEGEVVVLFSVTPSGEVENIQLKSTCDWGILNNEAIECIRRASPFPKLPFVLKEALVLSIKIIFKLE